MDVFPTERGLWGIQSQRGGPLCFVAISIKHARQKAWFRGPPQDMACPLAKKGPYHDMTDASCKFAMLRLLLVPVQTKQLASVPVDNPFGKLS